MKQIILITLFFARIVCLFFIGYTIWIFMMNKVAAYGNTVWLIVNFVIWLVAWIGFSLLAYRVRNYN